MNKGLFAIIGAMLITLVFSTAHAAKNDPQWQPTKINVKFSGFDASSLYSVFASYPKALVCLDDITTFSFDGTKRVNTVCTEYKIQQKILAYCNPGTQIGSFDIYVHYLDLPRKGSSNSSFPFFTSSFTGKNSAK